MKEYQVNIPNGWKLNKLSSVCKIKKGVQFSRVELNDSGMYPCINGGIEPSGWSDLWNTNENTITISEGGNSCGFVNIIKSKFWSGGHCYSLLDLRSEIENDFLYHALKGRQHLIMDLRVGSGLPNIQQKAIKEFDFLSPKKNNEQIQIATILSIVDEAISQTEQLIAKYTRIKTGLMQDLLTKGIDEHGNIRSEQTHEFKDSPLGRIPKEWECDTLISYCEKIQDGTHFSPKTDTNGKYKYITSKNVRMGYLDLTNLQYINEEAHKKIYKRCSVQIEDVLLTKDGASTGNICLNTLDEEFSLLSSVALIRGKKNKVLNKYIVQFFTDETGQKSLIDQMSGNAITRITLTKINKTLIKIPQLEEQQQIVRRFKPTDDVIIQEKIKLSKLQSIKTGLMQDLLSGKVRVNHLIKETRNV